MYKFKTQNSGSFFVKTKPALIKHEGCFELWWKGLVCKRKTCFHKSFKGFARTGKYMYCTHRSRTSVTCQKTCNWKQCSALLLFYAHRHTKGVFHGSGNPGMRRVPLTSDGQLQVCARHSPFLLRCVTSISFKDASVSKADARPQCISSRASEESPLEGPSATLL